MKVASMNLTYKDKTYPVNVEFDSECTNEGIEFMFEEGNCECDCNKSLFIKKQCDGNFPLLLCGDEIKISDFVIKEV